MKCPETLTLIRHDNSSYNNFNSIKNESSLYQEFVKSYEKNPDSDLSHRLALQIKENFSFNIADRNTPLANDAGHQSEIMSKNLSKRIDLPDVIFVSPYKRTISTLELMTKGWPDLKNIKTIKEERIIEQDFGLLALLNDRRLFYVLYPDQRKLNQLQGNYRYRFPQGENIPDVRQRALSWINTVSNDYSGKNVLAVTHHLTILSIRSNLESLDENEFSRLDQEERPINCGVTIYKNENNRLVLDVYNSKLY